MNNNGKVRFYGKIEYTMDDKHPDIGCVSDKSPEVLWSYEDIYNIDDIYDDEDMVRYIKNDLALIAGGGYDTEHIHNVRYDIHRI